MNEYYLKNKILIKKKRSEYYKLNKEHIRERQYLWGKNLKIDVFNFYCKDNIKCHLCSENRLGALHIDHINGNGKHHRSSIKVKGGAKFYLWLKQNNYPSEYRVLCANCNWKEHLKFNESKSIQSIESNKTKLRYLKVKRKLMDRFGGECKSCKNNE